MKKEYLGLIAGAVGIALATVYSIQTNSLWIGFYISLSIGIIYLIWLYKWAGSQLRSTSYKRSIGVMLMLIVILQALSVVYAHQKSVRQSKTLNEMGTSIDRTLSQATIEQDLIKALLHYHHKAEKNHRSISSSYKAIMGDRLADDGMIYLDDAHKDRLFYKAAFPDSNTVIINIASKISAGENPEFININNGTGRYQAKISLTSEGVNYVREN